MSNGWSSSNAAQRQEFGNWLAFAICNSQSNTIVKLHATTEINQKSTQKIVSTTFSPSNTPLPKWLRSKGKLITVFNKNLLF